MEFRKHARNDGRRYCDPHVLTYQAERMPEQIRLKVRQASLCFVHQREGLTSSVCNKKDSC